jgi:serine protease inhibitor
MSIWQKLRQEEILRLHGVTVPSPGASKAPKKCQETTLGRPLQDSLTQLFTFNLLHSECARAPRQNVFLSPLSVFLGLSMIENGAVAETKVVLRKVLGLSLDATDRAVNEAAAALLNVLCSNGTAEFSVANALWADRRSTLVPEFVEICEDVYDASARTLDFRDPIAASTINQWISEKTRGKISGMVSAATIADMSAVLTNAIYFKATFVRQFEPMCTRPLPFQLVDGGTKLVPMMMEGGLKDSYRHGDDFEVAILPYKDTDVALCMILPSQGKMPEDVLTENVLQAIFKADEGFELSIQMPKFTITFNASLRASLSRLGMGIAFEYPGANFSSLASPVFVLSDVAHKTRLEVDEAGSVAAAATVCSGVAMACCPPPVPIRRLIFDRPFAVLLLDTRTGTIVFAGVVYEP